MFNVVTMYIIEAITYAHIKAPETTRIGTQIHYNNKRHKIRQLHSYKSTKKKTSYIGAQDVEFLIGGAQER